MPRIDPLPRSAAPEFEKVFQDMEDALGYVPNSFFTMARHPGILNSAGALMDGFWYPDTVDEPMRRLVTYAYSHYAGSYYSSAHCACGAEELGLSHDKIMHIFDFETSEVYSEGERAVLRLCRNAARIPSEVTDANVEVVKEHYGVSVTTFIIGLIACMAFLNKWNELCGTTLEDIPRDYAEKHLGPVGWKAKV